ncbi:4346_t:CDS:1, partial [Scutellospora calospora]
SIDNINYEGITTVIQNNKNNLLLNIELEKRKIALLEYQIKARKEATETEAIEL